MHWPTELPLVAILRGIRQHEVTDHAQALVDAGFEAIEVPLNSPDALQSVQRLALLFGRQVWVGGGTVLQESQVDALVEVGARLVVTPHTRGPLIAHAVARGQQVLAGCATASEAFAALDAGAQALKLFPAATYGAGHAAALRSVLPPVPLFAVGGVTPENLPGFLKAGCSGAGLGGELYRPGQSVDVTAAKAREFVAAWWGVGA